jgi:dihydroflavonol-4-reductase
VGHSEDGQAIPPDHAFNGQDFLSIPYIRAKRDAELAARDFITRGLRLVSLYPGICLGPGDINLSSTGAVSAWVRRRLPFIPAGGGVPIIDVRDAAAALIAAMQHAEVGPRYFAPGYNLSLEALFDRLSAITHRRPPLAISSRISVPLAYLAERIGIPLPVEAAQARLMTARWWYADSSKVLGFQYRPLDDTLHATIEWINALAARPT